MTCPSELELARAISSADGSAADLIRPREIDLFR